LKELYGKSPWDEWVPLARKINKRLWELLQEEVIKVVSRNERDVKLGARKGIFAHTSNGEFISPTEGRKNDGGKNRLELISPDAEWGLGLVLTHGAEKYTDWNWAKGIKYSRVLGAIKRHLNAWAGGEELDKESGLPHVDHALCELMFLSHFEHNKCQYLGFDDRFIDQPIYPPGTTLKNGVLQAPASNV